MNTEDFRCNVKGYNIIQFKEVWGMYKPKNSRQPYAYTKQIGQTLWSLQYNFKVFKCYLLLKGELKYNLHFTYINWPKKNTADAAEALLQQLFIILKKHSHWIKNILHNNVRIMRIKYRWLTRKMLVDKAMQCNATKPRRDWLNWT